MASELGKIFRKHRIDKGATMKDMSSFLGVSSAFLSAIELGKKKITDELLEKSSAYFGLNEKEDAQMRDTAHKANGEIRLNISQLSSEDQNGVLAFARKYKSMSPEQKERLKKLLNE